MRTSSSNWRIIDPIRITLAWLAPRAWRHLLLALPVIVDAFVEDLGIDDLADRPVGVLASLVVLRVLGVHNCSCNYAGENFDVRQAAVRRWPSVGHEHLLYVSEP